MVKYDEVKAVFDLKGCMLLETREEFELITKSHNFKVRYIAYCKHEHIVFYNVFKNRNTGVICPVCVCKENGKFQKASLNVVEDGQAIRVSWEDNCIEYIANQISYEFDVKKTMEGCLSDFAIKPKSVNKNEWLMVQMKSTQAPNNGYGFHIKKRDYTKCIIICMCWLNKKIWIFDGKDLIDKCKITIGEKKSKYDDCYVTSDLIAILQSKYANYIKYNFNIINDPSSICQKIEKTFIDLRELKCNFIEFTYPTRNQLCYDFMIGKFRFQEKVGNQKLNTTVFHLSKNNGKIKNISQRKLYQAGDNDFYWLHLPDKKIFYVIPEHILKEHGYISEKNEIICTHKVLTLNPNNKNSINYEWTIDYMFKYDNNDVDKLNKLIQLR